MTIEGAIIELQNLIKADDIPFYYNGAIQKVIETVTDECKPKVGKWIEEYNGNGWNDYWDYTCSNCGKKYERADILYKANYCPNCGAKMEGK